MTDIDADVQECYKYIGYPNEYFHSIFDEFAPGLWDYVPCSEIACCFSYLAGNLSKIFVSNYAEGLVNLYRSNGRFGNTPQKGAFIWFTYGSGLPEHTGRVVDFDSSTVYTVEGNVGGVVVQRAYSIGSGYIYGYGYPLYTGEQQDTYNIRTKTPAGENLPYYNTISAGGYNSSIVGNGAISGANVMNNCVGYSQGRLMEMHNDLYPNNRIDSVGSNIYSIFNANAEDWYTIAQQNNIPVGSTPQLGSVGVWYSPAQGIGHVANIENYVNGIWEISEGHYNYPAGQGSWDYSRLDSNFIPLFLGGDPSWQLIGFINTFTVPYPPPGPIPPDPGPKPRRKMPYWMNSFIF